MHHSEDIAQTILLDREKGALRLEAEYRERLYSVAFALCHDAAEAEDLVFRTLERVIDRIETYEERDSFYDWICVILQNIYRDSHRSKIVKGTIPVGAPVDMEAFVGPTDAAAIVEAVDADIARHALEKIPPQMREVLILHYFMDMPTAKIAKFLALPVGTIKSRMHYARLVLGARLGARLKKPAVALIAAGLFLVAAASAIVSALANSDGETRDAPVYMATQAPSVPQDDD
jgi:RNA polymerase sigma-70 factor (ECF subfamily)